MPYMVHCLSGLYLFRWSLVGGICHLNWFYIKCNVKNEIMDDDLECEGNLRFLWWLATKITVPLNVTSWGPVKI